MSAKRNKLFVTISRKAKAIGLKSYDEFIKDRPVDTPAPAPQ